MVPWLRRRRLSVSSLAFAGWARRFRRARDPRTTVARSVSGRVRRHDAAGEYGARTAEEWLPLTLIGSGRGSPVPSAPGSRRGSLARRRRGTCRVFSPRARAIQGAAAAAFLGDGGIGDQLRANRQVHDRPPASAARRVRAHLLERLV